MIINLIYYLYGIKVDYVRFINQKYIFSFKDNIYLFKEVDINEDNLLFLLNNNLFHTVVKSCNNKYVGTYSDKNYILMKVNVSVNRFVLINDILEMSKKTVSIISFNNFSWKNMWKKKIDQLEYYINNHSFNIYILSIINYFIGLGEISINLLNRININEFITLSYAHRRLKYDDDLYSYYDVSNIIIDHYTRDLGEYIKDLMFNNKFDGKMIDFSKFNYVDKILLISRIVFPSCFFDNFDNFVFMMKSFDEFDKCFKDLESYDKNISFIMSFLQ